MTLQDRPTPSGIVAAAAAIDPIFTHSPLISNEAADEELGCRLFLKVETLNPVRSFKGRGPDWWFANLPASDQAVVCASAGNFGQGVAYAARRRGRKAIVFASRHANAAKIAAIRRFGAEVIQEGDDFDAAKIEARAFAARNGLVFVEDGDERRIAEGAGTIAKEMTDALSASAPLDSIVVPLGNGALLSGVGTWIRHAMPGCRIIGVVAETAPSMKLSWESGTVQSTDTADTIADGIAVREPVPYAISCLEGIVDEVVAVSEQALADALTFSSSRFGLVAEPAGSAGIAAIMTLASRFASQRVGTILCGSNVRQDENGLL